MTYKDFIQDSEGSWNTPCISSDTLGTFSGKAPVFKGGCIGIIPYNGEFIYFSEDDDHYKEKFILSKELLKELYGIYLSTSEGCDIKINYSKARSKTRYKPSKKSFFNKNRSTKNFIVSIKDRGKYTSPSIGIEHRTDENINIQTHDTYWCSYRVNLLNQILHGNYILPGQL